MFPHKMLIHQPIINWIQLGVNTLGDPCHPGDLLHHDRIVYRFMRIFSPGKRAMLIYDNARRIHRVIIAECFNNDFSGIEFISRLNLLFTQSSGAWNIAQKIVGMCRAQGRNSKPGLRPGRRMSRVSMNHAPSAG